jgi:hypothetical protein
LFFFTILDWKIKINNILNHASFRDFYSKISSRGLNDAPDDENMIPLGG